MYVADDDDFFDLGGDSLAATALVMALETIGVRLPVSVLFDAPTPGLLALVIESAGLLQEAALVTLKAGDARQTIFIAPGAGGSVLEMVPFARRIATSRQVCGLQPRGGRGEELTFDTIEQAARFYLPLIRACQPNGPYILAGYSMGGLVALELAQTLRTAGEVVELLIILDTFTPIEHFPLRGKLHFWLRRAVHHTAEIKRLHWKTVFPYAFRRARALARDFRPRVVCSTMTVLQSDRAADTLSQPPLTRAGATFLRYRPKFFAGQVVFIKSEGMGGKTHYPDILWKRLAGSVAIYDVQGDHGSMLFEYAGSVAAAFSSALGGVSKDSPLTKT